jgi:hypothetical protein
MEITNISNTDPNQFINQDYTPKDESLLNSLTVDKEFGLSEDKVELHIVSPNGELLESTYDFRNYTTRNTIEGTSLYNIIELNPKNDLESFGYFFGQYDIIYYFYRQLFLSSEANKFYIKEISSDRTEIKVSTNNTSYTDLGQSYLNFIAERNSRAFYSDFVLNFGDNKTYIAVNVALDNVNTTLPSLYIKLYEPLPADFKLKDTFWIVENISEPHSFKIDTEFIAEATLDSSPLRGPNINIELAERTNLTTPYLNLSSLLSSNVSSSYQQLQSWLEEKSVEITIDYNDYNNFVHFSSAAERLENFKYKLTQIQSIQSDIDALNNLNPSSSLNSISSSINTLQSQLNTFIEKFDGYEYFLYYESGSNCWPKTNTTKPYINDIPTSIPSKTWFGSIDETSNYYGGQILDASNYDINNKDYIWNNLPEYIKEDTQNSNLELFVAMMGQHYDYIWTYVRDITDLQLADNRIDHGISKDLVADTLRNFGIKLYTNSRNQDDLFLSLLGIDSNNSTLPSTGSYMINNYVTASQYTIPDNDIVKETYKRLYHNLPYLLKTKGTRRGLRALINCFGITDTILKIREYGGNRKDLEVIEQITPKFNYASSLNTTLPSNYILIPGAPSYKQYLDSGSNNIYPDTLEFRFKLDSNNILPTQSILESDNTNQIIRVTYISESYAKIDFGLSNSGNPFYSTPITLPLYNDDWWTLNLTRGIGSIDRNNIAYFNAPQTYTLTIGNKDSNGIQYLESCSMYRDGVFNSNFINSWLDDNLFPGGARKIYPFTGSIQEFRYWIGSIPINNFKDHILNPQSIVFDSVSGSYNNLIFRAPLGSELDINNTALTSVHPSNTASFWDGSTFSNYIVNSSYSINHENYLINTPNLGSFTEIDEKVRVTIPNLIPGDVLTPYISIQKPEEYPYTNDLNVVEVAISPQDSINADIIDQLGSFNIDEYIGDPRLAASGSYPALTDLRNFYFKKYSKKENIFDLIKLLSYFDNSLFKMIKDFVPAKANLSTGLVINTNILERNKIARHEPVLSFVDYSGSIETAFITGSNGLDKIYNTAYTSSVPTLLGNITVSNNDNKELLTGELGGTVLIVHSQSLDNIVYELNHIPLSTSQAINQNLYRLPINPTLNNVLTARTSTKYLDIDYSYNPITPVNFNFLTSSLFSNLNTTAFPFMNAPIQDSNYTLKRHITSRYLGSKLIGTLYNEYSIGDISYGSDPVINLNSVKFAYFNEITSQSLTFPGRSNVNIKYLIDSASNVIELTEANKSLSDVQDIFNKTSANIALENINQPSKQKALNGLKPIYAGGFRYEPILQNITLPNTTGQIKFDLSEPFSVINTTGTGAGTEISLGASAANIVSPFFLSNPLQFTPVNEARTNYCQATLDSYINANFIKNTNTTQDIYHRITGSVTFETFISPSATVYPILYSGNNRTGTQYTTTVPGYYKRAPYSGYMAAFWPEFSNNSIRSINIPARTYMQIQSYDGAAPISPYLYGPLVIQAGVNDTGSNSAPILNNNDLSALTWGFTDTYTDTFNQLYLNEFSDIIDIQFLEAVAPMDGAGNQTYTSTPLTSAGNNGNEIEYDNQYGVRVTFYIDALIKIPGNIPINTNFTATLLNKNLQPAKIRTQPTFFQYGGAIRFSKAPQVLLQNVTLASGDYFTYSTPPLFNYIGQFVDNGFNSGSAGVNWFFERGKEGDSYLNLTSSYDLSNFYYKYIIDKTNSITQTQYYSGSASGSSSASYSRVGYEDITTPFFPKKGDLIRFYNHDSYEFPINFEREILEVIIPNNQPLTSSYDNRLVFRFTEPIPNQSCLDYLTHIQNIIFLSKIEDETNVIIFHEKSPGQTSAGILLPENINKNLKNEAGDVIKKLKAQNLI